jgi:TRAP-type mannitol/chloroaromatic compound transport system substrate-binding protein
MSGVFGIVQIATTLALVFAMNAVAAVTDNTAAACHQASAYY